MVSKYYKYIFLFVITLLGSLQDYAYDFMVDSLCYNILSRDTNTVEVTYKGVNMPYGGDIVVPSIVHYNGEDYTVIQIGNFAFANIVSNSSGTIVGESNNSRLTSISLPRTIRNINQWAFSHCTFLKVVNIPYVVRIEFNAFRNCDRLKKIVLPEGLDNLGDWAFGDCDSLEDVSLPSTLKEIYGNPFSNCKNLRKINIDINNSNFTSIGNAIFSKDGARLCIYPTGLTELFVVPYGTKIIGTEAFSGSNIANVQLPNSLISIDGDAFRDCYNITNMVLPESLQGLATNAFYGCSKLRHIIFPSNLTEIGSDALLHCDSLREIDAYILKPFKCENFVDDALYSTVVLKVPYGTKSQYQSVSPWNKFAHIEEMAQVSDSKITTFMMDSVSQPPVVGAYISNYADGNVKKKGFIVSANNDNLEVNKNYNFSTEWDLLPNTGTGYGDKPLDFRQFDCTNINEEEYYLPLKILFGNKDYYVRSYFIDSSDSIHYGNIVKFHTQNYARSDNWAGWVNVAYSGSYTLFDCITDEIITNDYYYSTNENPTYCGHNTINVHSGVYKFKTEWNYKLWYYQGWFCDSTKKVSIPVMTYDNGTVSIKRADKDINKNITIYYQVNGDGMRPENFTNVYSNPIPVKEGDIVYCYAKSSDNYISYTNRYYVTEEVASQGATDSTHFMSEGIRYHILSEDNHTVEVTFKGVNDPYKGEIVIPASVSYRGEDYSIVQIGDNAFSKVAGLNEDGSAYSVSNNSLLTSITIPNSLTSIGSYAFRGCDGLTSITIPNSVTSIGDYSFFNCLGLTSITIPNSVTSIGHAVFSECSNLESIKVDDNNLVYDSRKNCNAIIRKSDNVLIQGCKNTVIPNSVTSIGNQAFDGCDGLTSITIPNSVTSIGRNAFYDCDGLTSITIPNSVTSIGYWAFENCDGLTSIIIPNSLTSIGPGVFSGCSNLASIKVDDNNLAFDSRGNCNAIIRKSDNSLIQGCKNTVIPNSVTSIGNQAFDGCDGLTSITIPNSVTSIGSFAFNACYGLTSITIPNSVTSIGRNAFYDCDGLTSITIPNSVTSIGYCAFSGCGGLTSISFPASLKSIGSSILSSCDNLAEIEANMQDPAKCSDIVDNDIYSKVTLKVPYGTKSKYQATADWSKFTHIEEMPQVSNSRITTFMMDSVSQPPVVGAYISNYADGNVRKKGFIVSDKNNNLEINKDYKYSTDWEYNPNTGSGDGNVPQSFRQFDCTDINKEDFSLSLRFLLGDKDYYVRSYFMDSSDSIHYGNIVKFHTQNYTRYNGRNDLANVYHATSHTLFDLVTDEIITNGYYYSTNENPTYCGHYNYMGNAAVYKFKTEWNYKLWYYHGDTAKVVSIPVITCSNGSLSIKRADKDVNKNITIYYQVNGDGMRPENFTNVYSSSIPVKEGDIVYCYAQSSEDYISYTNRYYVTREAASQGAIDITYYNSIKENLIAKNDSLYQNYVEWLSKISSSDNYTNAYKANMQQALNIYREYHEKTVSAIKAFRASYEFVPVDTDSVSTCLEEANECLKKYKGFDDTFKSSLRVYTISNTISCTGNGYAEYDGVVIRNKSMKVYGIYSKFQHLNISEEYKFSDIDYYLNKGGDNDQTPLYLYSDEGYEVSSITKNGAEYGSTTNGYIDIYEDVVSIVFGKIGDKIKNFTVDGLTYKNISDDNHTVNLTGVNKTGYIVLPSSVNYSGISWKLTGLESSSFQNTKGIISVTVPSTVKSVEDYTFSGCSELAAIVWNASTPLSDSIIGGGQSDNLLIYVRSGYNSLKRATNVIVDGYASNVVLTDATASKSNNFYCPRQFEAGKITYQHRYTMPTQKGVTQGWETISLPFDVAKITHESKGELVPFAAWSETSSAKPFWLYEMTSSGWRHSNRIYANTPYIISMPNNDAYDADYNLSGVVTFSTENDSVYATSSLHKGAYDSKVFTPCFSTLAKNDTVMALNVDNDIESYSGSYRVGSRFISGLRNVHPFEAYMSTSGSNAKGNIFPINIGKTTDIETVMLTRSYIVYNVQGQLLRRGSFSSLSAATHGLPAGVYIVNNRKVVVK